jgi:hypothetical protein
MTENGEVPNPPSQLVLPITFRLGLFFGRRVLRAFAHSAFTDATQYLTILSNVYIPMITASLQHTCPQRYYFIRFYSMYLDPIFTGN